MHTGICCTSWLLLPTIPYPSGNHGAVMGSKFILPNYGKVIHHNGVYIRAPSCELL